MLEMKPRRFLVGAREREQFRLAVQFPEKRQAGGSSGAAGVLEIAGSSKGYFGASLPRNPFGKITAGCPVRFVITSCSPLVGATITSNCRRLLRPHHRQPARSRGLDVFHCRDEACRSKTYSASHGLLRGQQLVFATAS